ncbi:MAG: D-Ala-D-Ala carboxypeptidase family metallohydrolase [Akkermansiaceae bacterium]
MNLSNTPAEASHADQNAVLDEYGRVVSRRGFLTGTAMAAAGLVLSAGEAEAGLFGYSSKPVAGIPESWVRLKGKNVYKYANFVAGLRLRNITPRMVLAPHFKTRGYTANSLPPSKMWKKMGPTLKIVDRMAGEIGRPVEVILSAYRSPRYNWAVGGKSRSLHMSNQAVDVVFRDVSPRHAASVARYLRDRKRKFSGGIGQYNSFVHIDTRGYNADW